MFQDKAHAKGAPYPFYDFRV